MPKKKSAVSAKAEPRANAIVLKTSPEYKAWLKRISARTLIPAASIVRDALKMWAAAREHEAPPPR